jgi:hypothetical protein
MALTSNYIYPTEVTGYVREALADFNINQFTLSRWLPDEPIDDIDYRVAAGGTGLADAAVYRTFDGESPIGRRQSLTSLTGSLAPLSLKTRCSEYDRLKMRKLSDDRIRQALFNDARKLTKDVAARVEIARGATLATGTTPIAELGQTINWGRSAAHTVTAATLWSVSTSDPLSDLMSWRDTYLATNGVEPGSIVVSRRIWNNMLRNQAVRNQVFGNTALYVGGNQSSIVNQSMLNQALVAQGLPQVELYQAQVNVNGVATKVLPDNVVLLLPPPVNGGDDTGIDEDTQLGGVFWGTTAEALDPRYGMEGDEPGIVAGEYSEDDPISVWTKVSSINLPFMANPNLSFAATVL